MEIEFGGEYDKKEFFRAVAMANMPSRRGRFVRIALLALIAVVFIALVADYVKQGNQRPDKVIRIALNVVILAYFLLSPYVSSWRIASTLWKRTMAPSPHAEGRVTGHGITYASATSEKEFAWEAFSRVRKARDMVVLVTADGVMSIHPRHFFRNEQDWTRFQQLVDYNVVEPK
jgi:hypothetical protein